MALSRKQILLLTAAGAALIPAGLVMKARGSDHADTPAIAAQPGTDLTDVFIFPSPSDSTKVVLAMDVHPLIPGGGGSSTTFDPSVLYQFKIDNTGDNIEDLVIQARFTGTGSTQQVMIAGPAKPDRTGTVTTALQPYVTTGVINHGFTPSPEIKVFAGAREDPFFFDLNQFFTIFPDRATPINGVPVSNPNVPQATSWRAPGAAQDFLAPYNVLSIVVELPKALLAPGTNKKIHVWCTTSK
ncbi:MAG: hypothetical protein JWQ02_2999 [Capsulimonas sp.]|nr:hypothetical protein [Capsulimonas sp.]